MFSSITSLFGGRGQGDYTAANSYLDSFVGYRKFHNKPGLTINWAAWKETGMAVDWGVNDDTGIFKSLTTDQALMAFDQIITADLDSIVVGELNYSLQAFQHVEKFPVKLSDELLNEIDKQKGQGIKKKKIDDLTIKGRNDDNYSQMERELAQIWAQVLELKELDIYDNFYQLGGDSILAITISNYITEELDKRIDVADLFQYLTIAELAAYLEEDDEIEVEDDYEIIEDEVDDIEFNF